MVDSHVVKFSNPLNQSHGDYYKELGPMIKYPRERLAKNILANTGRLVTSKTNETSKINKKTLPPITNLSTDININK